MLHFLSLRPSGRLVLTLALAGCAVPPAWAQSAAPPPGRAADMPGLPDPLDAAAAVPAPLLPRALSLYRPLRDETPMSWREANDNVTRIGGWRVYLREAHQREAAVEAATPASGARP